MRIISAFMSGVILVPASYAFINAVRIVFMLIEIIVWKLVGTKAIGSIGELKDKDFRYDEKKYRYVYSMEVICEEMQYAVEYEETIAGNQKIKFDTGSKVNLLWNKKKQTYLNVSGKKKDIFSAIRVCLIGTGGVILGICVEVMLMMLVSSML